MYKRILVMVVAAALAGLAVVGCSSSDSTPPPSATAKIRVVHASPDAGPVDVYLGTSASPWLEDLEYGQASTYLSRSPGTVTLVIHEAGADPLLLPPYLTEPIDMAAGASLTSLVAGLVQSGADEDKVRLITYSDNFQNSPTARARVVHAGSDAPNLTVTIGATGQVLVHGLARWAESGRAGVVYEPGMIQDIVVKAPGNRITSFRAPELEAQKDYYFILIGLIFDPGAATTPFDLLIVGPGGALDLEQTTPRNFRLVHTTPDGGPIDSYVTYGLGDSFMRKKIGMDLDYGRATLYNSLNTRQVFIEIYDVGADPDHVQPKFAQSAYIHDEAASTTIFAAGLASSDDEEDEVRLFSLADAFGVTPVEFLAAQLVHACPNLDPLSVDFGDDGSDEATMDRFAGNNEGWISLPADTELTMVVREGGAIVDVFTTPTMATDKDYYLILTGIKDGSPGFSLLSVTQDGDQGFTPPN